MNAPGEGVGAKGLELFEGVGQDDNTLAGRGGGAEPETETAAVLGSESKSMEAMATA